MNDRSGNNRRLSMALAVMLAISSVLLYAIPALAATYTDGDYNGTAPGYGGDVTVIVTIQDGVITRILPADYEGESDDYWPLALGVIDNIIEAQSPYVDAITGATASSNGIRYAVAKALASANTEPATTPDAAIFETGDGTTESPFAIATAAQLRDFASSVSMENNYLGYTVVLTDDIDISGENWSPIGGTDAFNGTFDGQGHTINGLTIGTAEEAFIVSEDITNVGFFANIGGEAVVRNLTMTDVYINVYHPGLFRVGALAGATGRREGVAGPIIDSVNIQGDVVVNNDNGNIWAGGYVGMLFTGSVINCAADVNVYALSAHSDPSYRVTNWVEAGGITGLNFWGEIVNSATYGDVTAGCLREEADEETAADNADALENGPKGTEEISVEICAVGGISGLDLGHTENVYTAGNVTAIGECRCIASTVGFSEETHSDTDYEYTHLDYVFVASTVTVDDNGEQIDIAALPRYEDGADIGTIIIADDVESLVTSLNEHITTMAADTETCERMNIFGSDASLMKSWVLLDDKVVPQG